MAYGTFKFDAAQHDFGTKTFLGQTGTFDGLEIIDVILKQPVTYKLGAPGHHQVMKSLAVLAAATLAGADLALAALALTKLKPATGRGTRTTLTVPGGNALLIDESYNANPASMRAAIALLGQAPIGRHGRRIAVLGDMLELGPSGAELHRALAGSIEGAVVDLVFCSGPLMHALWEALPSRARGGYAETAAELEPAVLGAIRAGDTVMVKVANEMGGCHWNEFQTTLGQVPAQG
jgi:UDP-N-acetylmuramoyl-tripeptide--D-alanyl-D-alanine ligase